MIYQRGDFVYPADLPCPVMCRVVSVQRLRHGIARGQLLELEAVEGPWPPGTLLIRLDDVVVPIQSRQFREPSPPASCCRLAIDDVHARSYAA
jgi:hypothetical protein